MSNKLSLKLCVGKLQCSCAVRNNPGKQVVAFAERGELGGGWLEGKRDGSEGSVGALLMESSWAASAFACVQVGELLLEVVRQHLDRCDGHPEARDGRGLDEVGEVGFGCCDVVHEEGRDVEAEQEEVPCAFPHEQESFVDAWCESGAGELWAWVVLCEVCCKAFREPEGCVVHASSRR